MSDENREVVNVDPNSAESETSEGLSYFTMGQTFQGDDQLIKVKVKSGTPEEVAADIQAKEGGSVRVARGEGNPEEGEVYFIKSRG